MDAYLENLINWINDRVDIVLRDRETAVFNEDVIAISYNDNIHIKNGIDILSDAMNKDIRVQTAGKYIKKFFYYRGVEIFELDGGDK